MQKRFIKTCFIIMTTALVIPQLLWGQDTVSPSAEATLIKAAMCENIEKFSPVNEAVVFSIDLGRVYCFTKFDPVPRQSVIYHKWYRRGNLIAVKQLTLNPPRWSSFSSMQLRDSDKGPWQVDLTDENDTILATLRFSITD